jgi:branched-chain amino acid transport system ATP-binding protein
MLVVPDAPERTGRIPMTPVLSATGISVSFGGVRAVVDVDLDVADGRLVGLIGPNGAGKTTFIDAISGFVRSRGRVTLDGNDLTGLAPHARARLGLARTWQSIELFDDLSVSENLLVASHRPSVWRTMLETVSTSDPHPEEIGSALSLLGLEAIADEQPSDLSQGERKLVGIARALVAKPRLLCLDEPAAGLDTHESEELGRRLRRLADDGQAMLLVDHDMGLVLGICDEVVVLEFGRVIARGAPDAVRRDPQVIAAYLGGAATELAPAGLVSESGGAAEEAVSEGDRG